MKKLLTITMAAALVLALTVPAMAMHFEMNGQLRVRSWYLDNYWPVTGQGDQTGDLEFFDQRFRTFMTWGLTESVLLKARADINEGFWGSRIGVPSEAVETDPVTGEINRLILPNTTVAKTPIAFDWVYMQFTLPGAPLTFKLGRQDVSWGPGIFAKADPRDRVWGAYKVGDWTIGGAYDKLQESFQNELIGAGSDNRNWAAFVVGNVSNWKLGFLYVLNLDETTTGDPIPLTADRVGFAKDKTLNMFDLMAIGATGPVSWKAEVTWAVGTNKTIPEIEIDREGFIGYIGGFFNAGMANVGLEGAYAQGNEFSADPNAKQKGTLKMDQHSPYNSVVFFNGLDYPGYDSLYLNNNATPGVPSNNTPGADQNFANAWSVKGTVSATPMEKLTLIAAVLYAKRNEVMPGVDKEMGWEIDGILSYNIYDNLAYTLGLGYASLGDFYTYADGSEPDNPWGMMNRFEVKF